MYFVEIRSENYWNLCIWLVLLSTSYFFLAATWTQSEPIFSICFIICLLCEHSPFQSENKWISLIRTFISIFNPTRSRHILYQFLCVCLLSFSILSIRQYMCSRKRKVSSREKCDGNGRKRKRNETPKNQTNILRFACLINLSIDTCVPWQSQFFALSLFPLLRCFVSHFKATDKYSGIWVRIYVKFISSFSPALRYSPHSSTVFFFILILFLSLPEA